MRHDSCKELIHSVLGFPISCSGQLSTEILERSQDFLFWQRLTWFYSPKTEVSAFLCRSVTNVTYIVMSKDWWSICHGGHYVKTRKSRIRLSVLWAWARNHQLQIIKRCRPVVAAESVSDLEGQIDAQDFEEHSTCFEVLSMVAQEGWISSIVTITWDFARASKPLLCRLVSNCVSCWCIRCHENGRRWRSRCSYLGVKHVGILTSHTFGDVASFNPWYIDLLARKGWWSWP